MNWQYQGRDDTGRFRQTTPPANAGASSDRDGMFSRGSLSRRIMAVAYGAIGALPQQLRARASERYSADALAMLAEAMTALAAGARLSRAAFADRYFGRPSNDPVAGRLHDAARAVASAASHDDLAQASTNVAEAMKAIGLDGWPRFVANVQARAHEADMRAVVEAAIHQPAQMKDAVPPVKPAVETAPDSGSDAAGGAATADPTASEAG